MDAKPRLLDRVRDHLRKLHYSFRTEQQYLFWIRRFILFHGKRHPSEMAARQVEDFLTHLAVDRKVSASTQNQALAAILFLYRKVLQVELPWLDGIVRAKQSRYLPVVLTSTEVRAVLAHLKGDYWLVGNLLYGAGLRLSEALQLRVKDIQFEYRQVIVRSAKGARDRSTILPEILLGPLQLHLENVKLRHESALRNGHAGIARSALGRLAASPHLSRQRAASREGRGEGRGHREASVVPHVPTLLRDALARARLRHTHRAGVARAQGCEDDADLHACDAQGGECGAESAGSVSANATCFN
jgi:integrase